MVLDLGDRARLRGVRADHNALARVHLGQHPALRDLDLSRNDLGQIALDGAPALERLHLARNRIATCDLTVATALRELRCHGNYIVTLDLTGCPAIELIDAHHNQLDAVVFGTGDRSPDALPAQAPEAGPLHLVEVDLADNRLRSLDLRAPALLRLDVGRNLLPALDLAGCPRLRSLDVSGNPLAALDLHPTPELVELAANQTRLQRLDIRANPALTRLRTAAPGRSSPAVRATEVQQRCLSELRAALGLGSGATSIEGLDAYELHDLALSISGRDADQRLLAIVSAPRCELGTALMVYWTSSPHYFRRYACRDDVPSYERAGWDLLAAIEERVARDAYRLGAIAFDPTDDRLTRSIRGIDWTRAPDRLVGPGAAGYAPRRELPARLQAPVRPAGAVGRIRESSSDQ